MFLTKLRTTALSAFVLVAACLAVRVNIPEASAQEPAKLPVVFVRQAKAADNKEPTAKAPKPGTLLVIREGQIVAMSPEGKDDDQLTPPKNALSGANGRLSPDGTRVAFIINNGKPRGPNDNLTDPWPLQVVIQKLGADKPIRAIDFPGHNHPVACWSPDGKKLAVSSMVGRDPEVAFENVLVDVESGASESLKLPANVRILDWSRDGKTFLVQECDLKAKKSAIGLMAKDEKEVTHLCDLQDHPWFRATGRLSPDGKKVLFLDADLEDRDARKWGASNKPYLLDIATKKRELLAEFPENARAMGISWSPDGKKVAYSWILLQIDLFKKDVLRAEDFSAESESFLIVADADGKNAKTIGSGKKSFGASVFGTIDWR